MIPIRPLLRRVVYSTENLIQAGRFVSVPRPHGGWPILLGISFPKSGTHLLDQILLGFSKVAPFSRRLHSFYAEYEGETGVKRSLTQALQWLNSLRPRDIASAHLFARPEVAACAASLGFVSYFIFRDPRDVAVSHVFYVTEIESRHVHHDYYASLPDFEARLRVSVLGRPELAIEFPDISARFAPYMGWLNHPEILPIHFEDLVNDRVGTLTNILNHFLARVPLTISQDKLLAALESSINPQRSPTFRSGKIGEWRKYFTTEHKQLFKAVTGNLLQDLGYEINDNW